MPFFIVAFYKKRAVIILTDGGDLGHVHVRIVESEGWSEGNLDRLVIPRVPLLPVDILAQRGAGCNVCEVSRRKNLESLS